MRSAPLENHSLTVAEDMLANISPQTVWQDIVSLVVTSLDADTVALFRRNNGTCTAVASAGTYKKAVDGFEFSTAGLSFHQAGYPSPLSVRNCGELRKAGMPEELRTVTLFPITSGRGFFGFIAIFNAALDARAADFVRHVCRHAGPLCWLRGRCEDTERKAATVSLIALKISTLFFKHSDWKILCDAIVDEAASLVDAENCSLMLPGQDDALTVSAARGRTRPAVACDSVRAGQGIAGSVYESGEALVITTEERLREYVPAVKPHFKTTSCISMPLKIADRILGILNVSDKATGAAFTLEDLSVLTLFSQQATVLLELAQCRQEARQMRALSFTDPLTGIFNRRYFDARLEEEYQRARRYGHDLSLAMVDIDDFKLFNDSEGHIAGDRIIREIATTMANIIRIHDVLTRFGGEEFTIIMPGTSAAEAYHVAERIRESIRERLVPAWRKFPKDAITVSVGVATYPGCGDPLDNLILDADRALYRAKRLGKDCTVRV